MTSWQRYDHPNPEKRQTNTVVSSGSAWGRPWLSHDARLAGNGSRTTS